jgi:UDP-N-acetylglucosamine acyltransferase
MLGGFPVRHYRLNVIGLRRAGVNNQDLRHLSTAYRAIRQHKEFDVSEATPEVFHLQDWLKQPSKRGLHGFIQPGTK